MRIGIDARFFGSIGKGLGRYTQKLIENLVLIDSKNQYRIFLQKSNWDYLKLGKNFKKVLADVPWYSFSEQVTLPKIFRSQNLDLLHVPHFNVPIFYNPPGFNLLGLHERSEFKGEFIVTIHDLIHHQFAETSTTARNLLIFKAKRLAYRQVIAHAIKKSAKIIVPSKNIKEEVISTFRIDPSKVVVTYEAAEEEYFDNQKLETRNLKLILVCPRDVFWKRLQEGIKEEDVEDQVALTGYIPARDLASTFRQAKAYVFPSFAEGFGIPGLNAMASGLPVVCSNIQTLKEIYSDAALYFDPNDPKNIADKLIEKRAGKNLLTLKEQIENILRQIATKTNLSLGELDLYLWYKETGKVLK